MPTSILANSLAALAAAAGVAAASVTGYSSGAYDDSAAQRLTRAEIAFNAWNTFDGADRNGDKLLSADEYAALAVVTAELAHLNGFISVETDGNLQTIPLPGATYGAISSSEHARIDAVARHTFYAFAGKDGKLDADEYIQIQNALFESADRNHNGSLTNRELTAYAQRQVNLAAGA